MYKTYTTYRENRLYLPYQLNAEGMAVKSDILLKVEDVVTSVGVAASTIQK